MVKDLGDVTLTINIGFGLKFSYAVDSDAAETERQDLSKKLSEYRATPGIQQLEAQLLQKAQEFLGYNDAMVAEKIETRDSQRHSSRREEVAGRAARNARRIRGR